MIRIPEDIESELQKKFPNVHMKSVIQHIFQAVLDKTLKDGSCHIREFGKFVAFKTHSSRLARQVIRFKFRLSNNLGSKIKIDDYLLDSIPVKAVNTFTDEHEKAVEGRRDQSKANVVAQKEAEKIGKERTKANIVDEEIKNIINEINISDTFEII